MPRHNSKNAHASQLHSFMSRMIVKQRPAMSGQQQQYEKFPSSIYQQKSN